MAALEATASFFPLLIDAPKMQLLITGLCLAGALLLGAIIIALVSRWWRKSTPQEDQSPSAQLAHFRSLYEKGAISPEEYERLRALLAGQMRETMGLPMPEKAGAPRSESIKTGEASRPSSDGPARPPGENGQPPDNPETGIRPVP